MKISKPTIFFLPLVLSLCILYICYPGFMSYDSFRMLEEARSSVIGGFSPPATVYILRLFDISGHGPTIMILMQNFITLLSMALILRGLGAGLTASIITMLIFLAMPTVIGCMLVLWRDVTMTALVMSSITLIFLASHTNKDNYYQAAKWISLSLLMVATLVRFNAVTSTGIVAIYWLSVFFKTQSWRDITVAFFLIVASMVASNKMVNDYRFPDFQKMASTSNLVYPLMANDLLGISGWSRVPLIPFNSDESTHSKKTQLSDIDNVYSSLGSAVIYNNNVQLGGRVQIYPPKYKQEDIAKAWLAAVITYPIAYINYRLDLFSEIIGAKSHGTYEPTHFNRIDENKFGIKFQDRYITQVTLKYIETISNTCFGKPWFVFLLSFFSVLLIIKSPHIRPECKMLSYYSFVAAFLYIMPFLLITLSGEVRYSFPAIVLSSVSIFVFIFAHDQTLLIRIQNLVTGTLNLYDSLRTNPFDNRGSQL